MSGRAPLRLFLVRHGQVPANREFRFIGASEEALSAEGEIEADSVGRAFEQVTVDAVFSSPRTRALATARRICPRARVIEELAEQDFGEWEGLTREEVAALGPEHESALAEMFEGRVPPPGGESGQQLAERVLSLVDRLWAEGLQRVVLVSHVGPIKAILAAALGLDSTRRLSLFLDTGTLSVVDWSAHPLVRVVNCRGTLGWQTARWMD